MRLTKTLSIAAATTILAAASANAEIMIKNLPDEGNVKVTGEVVAIEDSNEFTISDSTGTVEVESETDLNLAEGDNVIVNGEMDSGLFDSEIEADTVQKMDVILDRSDNRFVTEKTTILSELSTNTKADHSTNATIEDGNTKIKAPSYDVDVNADADVKAEGKVHNDAKDGSLKDFDNKHAKDVDLDVDVEVEKETKVGM